MNRVHEYTVNMFAYCVSDFVKYKLFLLPKKECNFAFQLQAALGQAFALSCTRIFTMVKGFVRNSQVTVHFIVQELGKKQSFWSLSTTTLTLAITLL